MPVCSKSAGPVHFGLPLPATSYRRHRIGSQVYCHLYIPSICFAGRRPLKFPFCTALFGTCFLKSWGHTGDSREAPGTANSGLAAIVEAWSNMWFMHTQMGSIDTLAIQPKSTGYRSVRPFSMALIVSSIRGQVEVAAHDSAFWRLAEESRGCLAVNRALFTTGFGTSSGREVRLSPSIHGELCRSS